MKNLIPFVIVAVASALIGYSIPKPAAAPEQSDSRFEELKSKLAQIGEVDIEEYLRLKDQKSRYEKADEIMGKILMLMLYDMGIKGSEAQLAKIKDNSAERPATQEAASPGENPTLAAEHSPQKAKQMAASSQPPAVKTDWKQNGEKVKEIYRADQVEEFLKSVEIPDFFNAMRTGTAIGEGQLEMINGNFTGRAVFEDPKDLPWNVQMSLTGEMQDGKAFGEFEVRLTKNGKQFSRTRSSRKRGERSPIKEDHFMGMDGDTNSVIINAYGSDGYFQLYFFPRLNEFHGLVYLKKSLGVFERKGVVHLTKR